MKNKERRKLIRLFSGIIVAIFIATIISICIGKYSIALTDIWNIICGNENVSLLSRKVFFTLRLPRTFMAIMAGAGLGLAGSVYQIIFKNPLASPDIIGIAGGANLGAALAIVVLTSSGMMEIAMGSFIGGFLAVLAVMFLVRATRSRATATYVLAGIVINAVSKAVIMGLKYFADPENEALIQKAFEELTKDKTVLMIAHRLSTIQNANCILVMEKGKLVEQGSHEELLAKGGLYADMWKDYQQAAAWKVGKEEMI